MTNSSSAGPLTKLERLKIFLAALEQAEPAVDRASARALLKETMVQTEDRYSGLPRYDYGDRMHVFMVDWKNEDSDPCYWDDAFQKVHRTLVYNDGRIQIARRAGADWTIILDKPGKPSQT